ncbi:hypothetical protein JCM16358_20910 [Halanaerocella petrolearia]
MRKLVTSLVILSLVVVVSTMVIAKDVEYKDGTYIGYVPDNHGDVVVKVEINQNKIADVRIFNPVKKEGRYPHGPSVKLFNQYPRQVVNRQSVNVDTVSGATESYNDYVTAVKMALQIAAGRYNDNIYYGISKDFGDDGYALLQVTVKGEQIKEVEIIPGESSTGGKLAPDKSRGYPHQPAAKAYQKFPELVVRKQETEIDTISGATYSTKAYNNALQQALKQAGLNL